MTDQGTAPDRKLLVAMPSMSTVNSETAIAFATVCMRARVEGWTVACANIQASRIERSRNLITDAAVNFGADYMLMIDSDMYFPQDTAVRMIAHNKPVVAVAYRARTPTSPRMIGYDVTYDELSGHETGLVEVGQIGFGITLIRMDVIRTLPKPWFRAEPKEGTLDTIGEDLMFSRAVRKAGYPIYVDMDLSREVTHIGKCQVHLDGTVT